MLISWSSRYATCLCDWWASDNILYLSRYIDILILYEVGGYLCCTEPIYKHSHYTEAFWWNPADCITPLLNACKDKALYCLALVWSLVLLWSYWLRWDGLWCDEVALELQCITGGHRSRFLLDTTPPHACLFKVSGVLTDPGNKWPDTLEEHVRQMHRAPRPQKW